METLFLIKFNEVIVAFQNLHGLGTSVAKLLQMFLCQPLEDTDKDGSHENYFHVLDAH